MNLITLKVKSIINHCLLFIILFLPSVLQAQNPYYDQIRKTNYIPDLINAGHSWNAIKDSIKAHAPEYDIHLKNIEKSILLQNKQIKSPTDSLILKYLSPFKVWYEDEQNIHFEIKNKGLAVIPILLEYLNQDAATRVVIDNLEPDEPQAYWLLSNKLYGLVVEISGIPFLQLYDFKEKTISKLSKEDRGKLIQHIEDWYQLYSELGHLESLKSYLIHSKSKSYNSLSYIAEHIAILGDTVNAITFLKSYYQKSKRPCSLNFYIIRQLENLGDKNKIIMEDCLASIYNYRCTRDNGIKCVGYIIKNAKSHIPYKVLADIVATERYSRMKSWQQQFIWHKIFNEMALTETSWSIPILFELLKLKQNVKENHIECYYWKKFYPEQYNMNLRVCDFALIKLSELSSKVKQPSDWENKNEIDQYISSILARENEIIH